MKRNQKNGFTLVELLAVIVILAIILVIAVPKVMSVINDSKKATLETTAKMIASTAEKAKVQNALLGNTETITCESVAKINDVDYEDCDIDFDGNTAKVTITGSGNFDGLYVCNGTKTSAEAIEESCPLAFEVDDWETVISKIKSGKHAYDVGDEKTIDMDIDGNGTEEEYTVRIANTTPCSEVSVLSETACGFVVEFKDIITTHVMNDTATNVGGWRDSEMRYYLNDTDYLNNEKNNENVESIINLLPKEIKNAIIDTTVVSSHGISDTAADDNGQGSDGNFTTTDKLYLLSTEEVWAQGNSNTINSDTTRGETATGEKYTRQLDYYKDYVSTSGDVGVDTNNFEGAKKKLGGSPNWWWLRSAYSDNDNRFYCVNRNGDWDGSGADSSGGVSPAFRFAE